MSRFLCFQVLHKVLDLSPLTQLVLHQRQVLFHQALGCCKSCVHSAADQPGHTALQHCADSPADHRLGLLHPILHRTPSLFHHAGQRVWDCALGAGHNVFSVGYHILGIGNNLGRDKKTWTNKLRMIAAKYEFKVGEETAVEKDRT